MTQTDDITSSFRIKISIGVKNDKKIFPKSSPFKNIAEYTKVVNISSAMDRLAKFSEAPINILFTHIAVKKAPLFSHFAFSSLNPRKPPTYHVIIQHSATDAAISKK